jgi:hypothetical protein
MRTFSGLRLAPTTPTRLREVIDSAVHGNRHVGLDHADFLSVNIIDSCYILLPGSFIPIQAGAACAQ